MQDAFEVRPADSFEALTECGMQIENRFSRAFDEAAGLAVGDAGIARAQVHRQLDDHPDTTQPAAFKERRMDFGRRLHFELRHSLSCRGNAMSPRHIPRAGKKVFCSEHDANEVATSLAARARTRRPATKSAHRSMRVALPEERNDLRV